MELSEPLRKRIFDLFRTKYAQIKKRFDSFKSKGVDLSQFFIIVQEEIFENDGDDSKERLAQISEFFRQIDLGRTGRIFWKDLSAYLVSVGPNSSQTNEATLPKFNPYPTIIETNFDVPPEGIFFNPPQSQSFTYHRDGTVRVWDSESWQLFRTLSTHTSQITKAGFISQRNLLVTASIDRSVKLFEGTNFEHVKTFHLKEPQLCYAYTMQEKKVQNVNKMNFKLLDSDIPPDLAVLVEYNTDQNHSLSVNTLSSDVRRPLLYTAGQDKTIHIFDLEKMCMLDEEFVLRQSSMYNTIHQSPRPEQASPVLPFSPSSPYVESKIPSEVSTARQSKLSSISPPLNNTRSSLSKDLHSEWITDLFPMDDMTCLASSSLDKTIKLWDVNSNIQRNTLTGHSQGILVLSYSASNRLLFSGGFDKDIFMWNPLSHAPIETLKGHSFTLTDLVSFEDSPLLISADIAGHIKLWDLRMFSCIQTIIATAAKPSAEEKQYIGHVKPRNTNVAVNGFIPNQAFSATAVNRQTMSVVAASNNLYTITPESNNHVGRVSTTHVSQIIFNPHFASFIVCAGHEWSVWKATTGQNERFFVEFLKEEISTAEIGDDGLKVFFGTVNGKVFVVDYRTGTILSETTVVEGSSRNEKNLFGEEKTEGVDVDTIRYSQNRSLVILCSMQSSLSVWTLTPANTLTQTRQLAPPPLSLSSLCISDSQLRILSVSQQNTVVIWYSTTLNMAKSIPYQPVQKKNEQPQVGVTIVAIDVIEDTPFACLVDSNGLLVLINIRTMSEVKKFRTHEQIVSLKAITSPQEFVPNPPAGFITSYHRELTKKMGQGDAKTLISSAQFPLMATVNQQNKGRARQATPKSPKSICLTPDTSDGGNTSSSDQGLYFNGTGNGNPNAFTKPSNLLVYSNEEDEIVVLDITQLVHPHEGQANYPPQTSSTHSESTMSFFPQGDFAQYGLTQRSSGQRTLTSEHTTPIPANNWLLPDIYELARWLPYGLDVVDEEKMKEESEEKKKRKVKLKRDVTEKTVKFDGTRVGTSTTESTRPTSSSNSSASMAQSQFLKELTQTQSAPPTKKIRTDESSFHMWVTTVPQSIVTCNTEGVAKVWTIYGDLLGTLSTPPEEAPWTFNPHQDYYQESKTKQTEDHLEELRKKDQAMTILQGFRPESAGTDVDDEEDTTPFVSPSPTPRQQHHLHTSQDPEVNPENIFPALKVFKQAAKSKPTTFSMEYFSKPTVIDTDLPNEEENSVYRSESPAALAVPQSNFEDDLTIRTKDTDYDADQNQTIRHHGEQSPQTIGPPSIIIPFDVPNETLPSITPQPSISIQPSITPQPSISIQPSIMPRISTPLSPQNHPIISPQLTISVQPTISPQPTISIQPTISLQPSISLQPTIAPPPSISLQPITISQPSVSVPSMPMSPQPSISPKRAGQPISPIPHNRLSPNRSPSPGILHSPKQNFVPKPSTTPQPTPKRRVYVSPIETITDDHVEYVQGLVKQRELEKKQELRTRPAYKEISKRMHGMESKVNEAQDRARQKSSKSRGTMNTQPKAKPIWTMDGKIHKSTDPDIQTNMYQARSMNNTNMMNDLRRSSSSLEQRKKNMVLSEYTRRMDAQSMMIAIRTEEAILEEVQNETRRQHARSQSVGRSDEWKKMAREGRRKINEDRENDSRFHQRLKGIRKSTDDIDDGTIAEAHLPPLTSSPQQHLRFKQSFQRKLDQTVATTAQTIIATQNGRRKPKKSLMEEIEESNERKNEPVSLPLDFLVHRPKRRRILTDNDWEEIDEIERHIGKSVERTKKPEKVEFYGGNVRMSQALRESMEGKFNTSIHYSTIMDQLGLTNTTQLKSRSNSSMGDRASPFQQKRAVTPLLPGVGGFQGNLGTGVPKRAITIPITDDTPYAEFDDDN